MNTTFLHLTSNLGSLFDDQIIEDRWYSELTKFIDKHEPSVVAIHCQEMGGKDFEANMPKVDKFIQHLRGLPCFVEYDRIRSYVDTSYTDTRSFTALGCFYLIHKSIQSISLWNFHTQTFEQVAGESVHTSTPSAVSQQLSADHFHFKDRFPSHYFPNVRWSRKGFLHTKWKINSLIVNLVNIHLFHDEDNLVALEQCPSVYSGYRQKALDHTLQHLSTTQFSQDESSFIFGDFNFRLDLPSVVKHLTSTDPYHPQFIRGEDGGLQKVVYRNSLSSGDEYSFSIERRKFYLNRHSEQFKTSFKQLLQFDNEMKKFEDLFELPVNFPPSYPFSEDVDKGNEYMSKRCPAWCDRVLLNKRAMDQVNMGDDSLSPIYDMMSKELCVGDHKPVVLLYSTSTTDVSDTSRLQQPSSEDH